MKNPFKSLFRKTMVDLANEEIEVIEQNIQRMEHLAEFYAGLSKAYSDGVARLRRGQTLGDSPEQPVLVQPEKDTVIPYRFLARKA